MGRKKVVELCPYSCYSIGYAGKFSGRPKNFEVKFTPLKKFYRRNLKPLHFFGDEPEQLYEEVISSNGGYKLSHLTAEVSKITMSFIGPVIGKDGFTVEFKPVVGTTLGFEVPDLIPEQAGKYLLEYDQDRSLGKILRVHEELNNGTICDWVVFAKGGGRISITEK